MAASLAAQVKDRGKGPVAIAAFTNCEYGPTFGTFIVTRLNVQLARGANGLDVVARERTEDASRELNLGLSKYYDASTISKIGKQIGAHTLILGNYTVKPASAVVSIVAEIRDVESGRIIGGEIAEIRYTEDIKVMLAPQGGCGAGSPSLASGDLVPTSRRTSRSLGSKDVGMLRVTIQSATLTGDANGKGLRCVFEFLNRDAKRAVVVALNSEVPRRYSSNPTNLRSSIIDDLGSVWHLPSASLGGLGFVRAGVHGQDGQESHSSSDILRLLRLRDDLGRDTDDPSDGVTASGNNVIRPYNPPGTPTPSPNFFIAYRGNPFIAGSMTTIEAGQTATVTMDFESASRNGPTTSFQMTLEIVVGVVASDMRRSYGLKSVVFERLNMPSSGLIR